jgi:hypothetical protein
MAIPRRRGEFRVELASEEPGMVWVSPPLSTRSIHRGPVIFTHASGLQLRQVVVVDFVTVAMALDDSRRCRNISPPRESSLSMAFLRAQAHGATQIGALAALLCGHPRRFDPFGDQRNQRDQATGRSQFGAMRPWASHSHVAGDIRSPQVHAQTDAEIGNVLLTGM